MLLSKLRDGDIDDCLELPREWACGKNKRRQRLTIISKLIPRIFILRHSYIHFMPMHLVLTAPHPLHAYVSTYKFTNLVPRHRFSINSFCSIKDRPGNEANMQQPYIFERIKYILCRGSTNWMPCRFVVAQFTILNTTSDDLELCLCMYSYYSFTISEAMQFAISYF